MLVYGRMHMADCSTATATAFLPIDPIANNQGKDEIDWTWIDFRPRQSWLIMIMMLTIIIIDAIECKRRGFPHHIANRERN